MMNEVNKDKPTKIQVVRYFRPSQITNIMVAKNDMWKPEYIIAGNRGVTVIFDIDYETRTFVARYSICRGDTFNKGIGYAYAQACEFPFEDTLGTNPLFEQFAFGIARALDYGTLRGKKKRDYTILHEELLDVNHDRVK